MHSMNNSISFSFQYNHFICETSEPLFISVEYPTPAQVFDVHSNITTEAVTCPHCGSKVHVYDNSTVLLKDIPFLPKNFCKLRVHLHRFRCTKCSHSFTEEIPFKYQGTRVTTRAARWIACLLACGMSIKDVSRITGIHWDTISKIHKDFMDEKINKRIEELMAANYKPKHLAVDEFAIHKGHTYATCVMDLDLGDIIWVGKGRSKKDFEKFFEDIPADYLSEVEAVAMDMNASYHILVKEKLPHAAIVYDRYHMQAQFGKEVLGTVRLDEAKIHKEKSKVLRDSINSEMSREETKAIKETAKEEQKLYTKIKQSRWMLLENSSNLSTSKSNQLEDILQNHERLAICYVMKEEMSRLFELTDPKEAAIGWKNWFEAAKSSGIEPLVHFAELKEKRLPGLIAHAEYNISTGRLEGFNNRIKVAKRIGYGYRNDEYFFTLIKYISILKAKSLSPRNP